MAMIPTDKQELEKALLWKDKDTGEYFFRLEYICENDAEIYRLIYPKVDTGIPLHRASLNRKIGWLPGMEEHILSFTCFCEDGHSVLPDEKGNYIYTEVIQEKTYEMTLEQIEKKLGYKIKIVSEAKEKK